MLINSAVTVNESLFASAPEELPLALFDRLHEQLGLDFEVHAGKVKIPFDAIGTMAGDAIGVLVGIDLSTKSDSTAMVERSVS